MDIPEQTFQILVNSCEPIAHNQIKSMDLVERLKSSLHCSTPTAYRIISHFRPHRKHGIVRIQTDDLPSPFVPLKRRRNLNIYHTETQRRLKDFMKDNLGNDIIVINLRRPVPDNLLIIRGFVIAVEIESNLGLSGINDKIELYIEKEADYDFILFLNPDCSRGYLLNPNEKVEIEDLKEGAENWKNLKEKAKSVLFSYLQN